MMKNLKRRLRSKKGFTLAEVFIALLIMLMVSAVVAAGIPAASKAYDKTVTAANAQTLLSTTLSCLRDELATASGVTCDGGEIRYNGGSGGKRVIYNGGDSAPGIHLCEYLGVSETGRDRLLVSREVAGANLRASYESVSYTNGVVTFTGIKVFNGSEEIAGIDSYSIKVISHIS
ncbi:MAG: hypothetical protein J5925_02580 [Clostridia bacterium]|nr:hypothetical protein [Clostridia bacterium]MBR5746413.1 hypothetical protein [Clostridia bacterium]